MTALPKPTTPYYFVFQTLLGPCPQCCIPSPRAIGSLVLEEIFKGFLPYMGMVASFCMWPACVEQTFVLSNYWGAIWNLALIGPVVSEKKKLEDFPYMSLCKTNYSYDWASFEPRALIWTILVEVLQIKLHIKCQRPGLSTFRQEDFYRFAKRSLCKMVKVNLRLSFFHTLFSPCPQCCKPSSRAISPLVLNKIFKGFLPYMGVVTISVMWPWCLKLDKVPSGAHIPPTSATATFLRAQSM